MSRRARIEAAIGTLKKTADELAELQDFGDCVGASPEADGCLELAVRAADDAAALATWSLSFLTADRVEEST